MSQASPRRSPRSVTGSPTLPDLRADPVTESDVGLSTRDAILLEAQHCFAEQGFSGTSLNDIAAGVGIRKTSLLHHFPNKEAIYREVFESALSVGVGRVEAAVAVPDLEGWSKADHVVTARSTSSAANPEFVRIMQREAVPTATDTSASTSAPSSSRSSTAPSGFFETEMGEGRFRKHDPAQLIITGTSAILGFFSDVPFWQGVLDEDPLDDDFLDARMEHLRAFFLAVLEPIDR